MVLSLLMVAVRPDDIERYFFDRRLLEAACIFLVGGCGRRCLFEAEVVETSAVSTGLCGSQRGGGETLTC